jgi:hypothetical protein
MPPFSNRKGNNHDINEVQRITSKPTRRNSRRPMINRHPFVRTPQWAVKFHHYKYMTQTEINALKNNKLKMSIPSGNLKMNAPQYKALNRTSIPLSNRYIRTYFPNNRIYLPHSKLKPNSQISIPNSNTLVQNAGTFSFSNELKEVGFTLQPGGKSTTVLGGVKKQNKKANKSNKKANSNSNNLTRSSWRNTMRMITPKKMVLGLCYLVEDTQHVAEDLRKACRKPISSRKFFSSRARRNSYTNNRNLLYRLGA